MISNKTGYNVNFVRELIISIKSKSYLEKKGLIVPIIDEKTINYSSMMYIDSVYNVTGIGIVLSGTVKFGDLHVGQKVFLGPINGNYINITIKSIHNCVSESIEILRKNESGSIGIRLDKKGVYRKENFLKGHVVISDIKFAMHNTCYSFNCDVAIFNHPTTIKNGYQTIVHCGTIRRAATFLIKGDKVLRTNTKENINVRFVYRPEFILPGSYFMFREGRTRGMGKIISTTSYIENIN